MCCDMLMCQGWGSSEDGLAFVGIHRNETWAMPVNRTYLSLATGQSHVDESSGVRESLLGTALRSLGLLLLLDLL